MNIVRKLVALLMFSFLSMVGWGIYTAFHYQDPVSWGYCVGSAAMILGPLAVALVVMGKRI